MVTFLNLGSLVLGFISWIIPVVGIILYRYQDRKIGIEIFILSLTACLFALFFQIINAYHLVNIEDWSAIMDTHGAVTYSSVILVITTLTLNIITYILYRKEQTTKNRV